MTIEGKFEYNRALTLTPERMKELERIILKYCSSIQYKVETINESEISFASLDELLSYDNFAKGRLKSIDMRGNGETVQSLYLTIDSDTFALGIIWCGRTCYSRYVVGTTDIETNLKNDLQLFFQKITSPYWLIAKFRLSWLLILVCMFSAFLLIFSEISSFTQSDWLTLRVAIIFVISTAFAWGIIKLCKIIDNYFLARCFPSVAFVWGEERFQQEKYNRWRNNLFWGVIIAIIVGIITTFITSLLF